MRNAILTFVYKVIPEEQKNAELAINELRNEEGEDDDASENDDIADNAEAIYKKMNSERVNSKSDDIDVADSSENSFSSLEEAEKFFNAAQSSMKKGEK